MSKTRQRTRTFSIPGAKRKIRLIQNDCIDGMAALSAGSVDVVVTSPPYNAGKAYRTYKDRMKRSAYLTWTRQWGEAVARVLSEEGSFFLNIGGRPSDPWLALQVATAFGEFLKLQNVIHWVKSIAIEPKDLPTGTDADEAVTFGHYQPINSERYLNACHEYVFQFTHTGNVTVDRVGVGVPYQDKSNVARWKGAKDDLRCRGNTWFIPYETIQSRDKERPHPATFPVKLPEMCLRLHGLERVDLAMDPFVGLGSSAVACAKLGIPFVGFDIDAQYLADAGARVETAFAGGD